MKKAILCFIAAAILVCFAGQVFAVTPEVQKGQKIERLTGRVSSVNATEMVIVVESMKAGMTFDAKGAKLKGYKTIDGIKEGDRVTVQYVMREGHAFARSITKNRSYQGVK